jgi:biotin carboxylase
VASCRAPRSNRPVRYVGRRTALKKLLVANRGEIAVRVMRSAREIGLLTVAVYSESDRDALHVAYADEAFLLGPASPSLSYLNVEKLLDVAARSGADAVHPGYGFLAENAGFARAVIAAGLTWVGPHPDAIDAMGDKIRSRQAMVAAGVPVVPGATTPLRSADDAIAAAKEYGLPIALKASGGGGGKGLKIARTLEEVPSAFATAEREAEAYFKNPIVYVERYLDNPKHVELQILADKHGNVVHVGERDCSLQRRHQKLYEETPALVSEAVRERLREAGIKAARAIGYDSVGTIETLVAGEEFFFLEMNTRIQVEHTISEMTSGLDLIAEQLRVAAGEPLGYGQSDIHFRGHAIEVRVNAEDPAQGFRPAPGTIVPLSARGYDDFRRLRFDDREAHRLGSDARRSASTPEPCDRRVSHRGRTDDARVLARAQWDGGRQERKLRDGNARSVCDDVVARCCGCRGAGGGRGSCPAGRRCRARRSRWETVPRSASRSTRCGFGRRHGAGARTTAEADRTARVERPRAERQRRRVSDARRDRRALGEGRR